MIGQSGVYDSLLSDWMHHNPDARRMLEWHTEWFVEWQQGLMRSELNLCEHEQKPELTPQLSPRLSHICLCLISRGPHGGKYASYLA